MTAKFPLLVREAFTKLDRETAHLATNAPRWADVFTPPDHQGALDPDRPMVIGDRGTGKSFWSSVLISNEIRNIVATEYPTLALKSVEGRLGFSDAAMAVNASHPSATEIATIMQAGFKAEDLWRAVLLRQAPCPPPEMPDGSQSWQAAVEWVAADPARRNADFRTLDQALIESGKRYVLVFDALDVVADHWAAIRSQIEGMIKLGLAVRALQAVRVKFFIRPDMAEDRRIWDVGDASKLRHREVNLNWRRRDLYGLLWTLLANAQDAAGDSGGKAFRDHCSQRLGLQFQYQYDSWRPPFVLVDDEARQQEVFRALAGDYMGTAARNGDTYKWVPNHLSDAAGYAAPRTFLLAMQKAATETKTGDTVLNRAGIHDGAREASKLRVQELLEDYKWMNTVLKDMANLVVPITSEGLISRWKESGTWASLKSMGMPDGQDRRFIPPGNVLEMKNEHEALLSLIEQLKHLKIFFPLRDGRINMPDLFRLQANVKRKGGMKPRA